MVTGIRNEELLALFLYARPEVRLPGVAGVASVEEVLVARFKVGKSTLRAVVVYSEPSMARGAIWVTTVDAEIPELSLEEGFVLPVGRESRWAFTPLVFELGKEKRAQSVSRSSRRIRSWSRAAISSSLWSIAWI